MTEKICTKCLIPKLQDDFSWRNKEKGIKQVVCRECHSNYLKEHYKNNPKTYLASSQKTKENLKAYIRQAKEVPCMDCKVQYPYYVMDFDHRENKSFNLSQYYKIGSLRRVQEEMRKCDIVCSNCHRERTFGRVTVTG